MSQIQFSPLVESIYAKAAKGKVGAMLLKISPDAPSCLHYGGTVAPIADLFISLTTQDEKISIVSCDSDVSNNIMLLFDFKDDAVRLAVIKDETEIISTDNSVVEGHIFAAAMTKFGQKFFVDVSFAKDKSESPYSSLITDAAPELIRHFASIADLLRKNALNRKELNFNEQ